MFVTMYWLVTATMTLLFQYVPSVRSDAYGAALQAILYTKPLIEQTGFLVFISGLREAFIKSRFGGMVTRPFRTTRVTALTASRNAERGVSLASSAKVPQNSKK